MDEHFAQLARKRYLLDWGSQGIKHDEEVWPSNLQTSSVLDMIQCTVKPRLYSMWAYVSFVLAFAWYCEQCSFEIATAPLTHRGAIASQWIRRYVRRNQHIKVPA